MTHHSLQKRKDICSWGFDCDSDCAEGVGDAMFEALSVESSAIRFSLMSLYVEQSVKYDQYRASRRKFGCS